MKRVIPIVLVLVLLLCGCQTEQTKEAYNGLILEAPATAVVALFAGYEAKVPVTPAETKQDGDMIYYYYPDAEGGYYYELSAAGCYSKTQALYIPPHLAQTETRIRIVPEPMAGNGWEPSKYQAYTYQMMDYKTDNTSRWPNYQEAFSSPAFAEEKAAHQCTTQQEMEAFIKALDDENDSMYIYSAGTSTAGKNIPLVIFTQTDLSGAASLEEAGQLLHENGKLTIHYQGNIHGNEPAGGEAALGMIKRLDGDLGEKLLETVNVYVIPRVNADGAEKFVRKNPINNVDMNRDLFQLQCVETRNIVKAAQLLDPAIVIDSHEYTANIHREYGSYADLMIGAGFSHNDHDPLAKLSIELMDDAFTALEREGLSYKYYLDTLNSENITTVRDYFCRLGKLTFVLESQGINYGNVNLNRRTVSHMVGAWEIMSQVAAQPQLYLDAVNSWKEHTIEAGKTFSEDDPVILQRQKTEHPEYDLSVDTHNLASGEYYEKNVKTYINDMIVRSRPAPTAYVIPADSAQIQTILDLMDLHGISYTKLRPGTSLRVQQYIGNTDQADLATEKAVYFPQGAYLFTMAQEEAYILSLLMEPDVNDMEGSTIAQMGLLDCRNEVYQLYRYVRDLKEDGSL